MSLFIGILPGGVSYADRDHEEHGEYARVAFLPYDTLALSVEAGARPSLVEEARAHAATLQSRKGQLFPISACGQTVRLGKKASPTAKEVP